jgi:hypothetical protein
MPYVDQIADVVTGVYHSPQSVGQTFLPDTDPGVIAFLNPILTIDGKTITIDVPKIVTAGVIVSLGALLNNVAVPAWAKTAVTNAALAITNARNS